MSKPAKNYCVVVYDGVQLLDIAGPAEVFAQANREVGREVYRLSFHSDQSHQVTSAGLPLVCQSLEQAPDNPDCLIIPGANLAALQMAITNKPLLEWLSAYAQQSASIASVCSGAFILAELGLLNGRKATTHWQGLDQLQQQYPEIIVVNDVLYVQDGPLWSSAGVLAGVDMALAMVAQDLGYGAALAVAKNLVAFMLRQGNQPQFSAPLNLQQKAANSKLLQLVHWLEQNLDQHINVEQMAEYMNTSVRSLHRRCIETLSLSPAKLFTQLRLEQGKLLLHHHELSIKQIALQCGFSDSSAFSKAFNQQHQLSPLKYRHKMSRQSF